jgi:hypothetical protein
MQKFEEENWITYEIDTAELNRLVSDVSPDDLNQFCAWMVNSSFNKAYGGGRHLLQFPNGVINLTDTECPPKFHKLIQAFLDHTDKERKIRPVLLKLTLCDH